jgi:hypothetical protein
MNPALYQSLRELFVEAHDVTLLALNVLGQVDKDKAAIDGDVLAEASYKLRQLAVEIVCSSDRSRHNRRPEFRDVK